MTSRFLSTVIAGCLLLVMTAGRAAADVCVTVDETHDTFSPRDRTAALHILARQFELAGQHVISSPCPDQYVVTHVQLGATIFVTLTGPKGDREATAIGLDDIPAVYNQMVRSVLTGEPMDLRGVVDRTNVSGTQAAKLRVDSDSVFYARLGYGAIFADPRQAVPSVGLIGYRHELDSFAIDVSFLNFQLNSAPSNGSYYGAATTASSGSWIKLEGLYFTRPLANRTAYFGGGLSWGGTSISDGRAYWDGTGLQGELTAGYEMARASTIRVFAQADLGLPFYSLAGLSYSRPVLITAHQYAPSLTFSIGLGWERSRHRRP
jgi:hypothetical protein